jgi:hypothetical protein
LIHYKNAAQLACLVKKVKQTLTPCVTVPALHVTLKITISNCICHKKLIKKCAECEQFAEMFFQLNKNNNNPNYSSYLSIQALDGWMMDDELHSPSSIHIHRQLLLHLATDPKSASLPHQS